MLEFSIHLPIFNRRKRPTRLRPRSLGNRDIADVTTYERQQSESAPTCGQRLSLSSARTAQLEASRFASAGFPLCLPPVLTPCGRRRRAAYLPRTTLETFRGAPLPFPVPEQSFPDAAGILQTWPTGFAPAVIVCNFVHTGAVRPQRF